MSQSPAVEPLWRDVVFVSWCRNGWASRRPEAAGHGPRAGAQGPDPDWEQVKTLRVIKLTLSSSKCQTSVAFICPDLILYYRLIIANAYWNRKLLVGQIAHLTKNTQRLFSYGLKADFDGVCKSKYDWEYIRDEERYYSKKLG